MAPPVRWSRFSRDLPCFAFYFHLQNGLQFFFPFSHNVCCFVSCRPAVINQPRRHAMPGFDEGRQPDAEAISLTGFLFRLQLPLPKYLRREQHPMPFLLLSCFLVSSSTIVSSTRLAATLCAFRLDHSLIQLGSIDIEPGIMCTSSADGCQWKDPCHRHCIIHT